MQNNLICAVCKGGYLNKWKKETSSILMTATEVLVCFKVNQCVLLCCTSFPLFAGPWQERIQRQRVKNWEDQMGTFLWKVVSSHYFLANINETSYWKKITMQRWIENKNDLCQDWNFCPKGSAKEAPQRAVWKWRDIGQNVPSFSSVGCLNSGALIYSMVTKLTVLYRTLGMSQRGWS